MIQLPDNDPRKIALMSKDVQVVAVFGFSGSHVGRYVSWSEPVTGGGVLYQPIPIIALGVAGTSNPPGRNVHELAISDNDNTWSETLNISSGTGLKITVGAIFLTDNGWTGELRVFSGKVVQTIGSANESGKVLGLKCASLLSQIDSTHAVHITDSDQRKRDAMDNCFASINQTRDSKIDPEVK